MTKLDLMTIEAEDILASRVFKEGKLDSDNDRVGAVDHPHIEN